MEARMRRDAITWGVVGVPVMAEPSTIERPDIAVILAFPSDGAAPAEVFAGLPLALRTVLTLRKEGAKTAFILGPDAGALAAQFTSDSRVKIALQAIATSSMKDGFEALRDRGVSAPFLVGMHDAVVDPAIY